MKSYKGIGDEQPGFFARVNKTQLFVILSGLAIIISVLITLVILLENGDGNSGSIVTSDTITRIGFGSCTSYDIEDLTIFDTGITPLEPQAFIWAGDAVYADGATVNCNLETITDDYYQEYCNCTADWLHKPPYACNAADVNNALYRYQSALRDISYNNFLNYMCPGALESGFFPPEGTNPHICKHPITGVYDDHDYGANNGYRRMPNKFTFKNYFLDFVGESYSSPRRNLNRGLWFMYQLNTNLGPKGTIDVYLLDSRYDREQLPCYVRKDYCENLAPGSTSVAWCDDYLYGGIIGEGTCCTKDEDIFLNWCLIESNKASEYWGELCDVSDPDFGMRSLIYDNGTIRPADSSLDQYDDDQESPFCEMMGKNERKWLRHALSTSQSPLKLIVSGSVVLGNPANYSCGNNGDASCTCSSDDWECFKPAQLELLHMITTAPGCTVILTGDFHLSDIRVLKAGTSTDYYQYYNSSGNSYDIYQIMASGMTNSTAIPMGCTSWNADPLGLRVFGSCEYFNKPAFGFLLVNYDKNGRFKSVTMEIRNELGNVEQTITQELKDCNPID